MTERGEDIQDLFMASRGKPVVFRGETIKMVESLPVPLPTLLTITHEYHKPGWRQGIALSTKGEFRLDGEDYSSAIVLWADTAPEPCLVEVRSRNGICHVKNVWDTGNGTVNSWHNGAAMIVDEIGGGFHFRCNDSKPNTDFDDIVFRIEMRVVE